MSLCFVTNNKHKLEEVKALLPQGYPLVSLPEIGCFDEIPETQNTLEGNARQKAEYIYRRYGLNCFADDTGLEVESLGGAPGVHSARYAGPQKDHQANCIKLLQELKEKEKRQAQFRTVICLIKNDRTHFFEGLIPGIIVDLPRGDQGFGYDALFQPLGSSVTFGEMNQEEKNLVSHRGKAIRKLAAFLNNG